MGYTRPAPVGSKVDTFAERAAPIQGLPIHRHYLQTDNNVEPIMGAVHLVRPTSNMHEKHFMVDLEGDANEGRKELVDRSRRGPFAQSKGRSTMMNRSAHVSYRNRRGVFEITVRRGVTESEVELFLSKLRSHSFTTDAYLVIIKGKRRYRLGKLREYDLAQLETLVRECVQQYGSCGLEVSGIGGKGALFKPGVHGVRFQNSSRRKIGV